LKEGLVTVKDRYRGIIFPALLFLSLTLAPCPGLAEGEKVPAGDLTKMPLEELLRLEVETVTTASRFRQPVFEAPSSVSVVTSADIRAFGYRTLADILAGVRDFYVSYDRNYSYLGGRGFSRPGDYNTRYLLMVDGHRINDAVYDQASIGTDFPVDVDLIDRIEVIRGPGSSLYGTNAFLGVINVKTKRATEVGRFEVSGEAGTEDTFKGRLTTGIPIGEGSEIVVSASKYRRRGKDELYFPEFDNQANNHGVVRGNDADASGQIFVNAAWGPFNLQGAMARREKDIPTAPWDTVFGAPGTKSADERGYVDLRFARDLGAANLTTRLWYDHYRYEGDYVFSGYTNRDLSVGEWWGAEAQLTGKVMNRHEWVAGMEYNGYIRQDQYNWDDNPYQSNLDDIRRTYQWAAYLSGNIRPFRDLILSLGARFDRYGTFGNTFNPRLGLVYSFLKDTSLKILYGTAFRAPNVYELYYNDGGKTTKASPDLKAEKISTYEAVLEHSFPHHLRVAASVFHNAIDDLIVLIEDERDGLLVFRNVEKQETTGASAEVEKRWGKTLRARLAYTYQESKDKTSEKTVVASPRHLVKFHLQFPLFRDALQFSLEELYVDSRLNGRDRDAAAYFVTNLTLLCLNWAPRLEASLSLYDAFNRRYEDPASAEHRQETIAQDGRTLRLKLTWRY